MNQEAKSVAARFARGGDSRSSSAAVSSMCSPLVRLPERSGSPSPACDCSQPIVLLVSSPTTAQCFSSSPKSLLSPRCSSYRQAKHSVMVEWGPLLQVPPDFIRSGLLSFVGGSPPRLVSRRHQPHRVSVRLRRAAPAFARSLLFTKTPVAGRGPCGNRMVMRSSHWLPYPPSSQFCSALEPPLPSALVPKRLHPLSKVSARPRQTARVVSIDWSLSPPARLNLAQAAPSFGRSDSSSPGWPKRVYTTLSRRSSTRT